MPLTLYANGQLIHVRPVAFKGSDGKNVTYNEYSVLLETGVVSVNSQKDFSQYVGREGKLVFSFGLRSSSSSPKDYKLSLLDVNPAVDQE